MSEPSRHGRPDRALRRAARARRRRIPRDVLAGADGVRARHRRRATASRACGSCCSRRVDERGFVFYTNYESRKGRELLASRRAAMCFHWQPLETQVRVEGTRRDGERRRGRRLLRVAGARQPDRRVGVAPEPADARTPSDLDARVAEVEQRFAGRAGAAAAALVRLPHRAGAHRVLEEHAEPAARAARVHARAATAWRVPSVLYPVSAVAVRARRLSSAPWLHESPNQRRPKPRPPGRSRRRARSTTSKAGAPASSTSTSKGHVVVRPDKERAGPRRRPVRDHERSRGAGHRAAGAAPLLRHPALAHRGADDALRAGARGVRATPAATPPCIRSR